MIARLLRVLVPMVMILLGMGLVLPYPSPPLMDVVIVGGGLSGLSSAMELAASGRCRNITIIEALPRLGGRVISWAHLRNSSSALVASDLHSVDLGATFIHGIEDNPIKALADRFGLPTTPVDYDSVRVYYPNGTVAKDEDVDQVKARVYDKARELMFQWRDSRATGSLSRGADEVESIHRRLLDEDSLQHGFSLALESMKNDVRADQATRSLLSWHFFWEIVQDQIATLDELSAQEYDASVAFRGPDHVLEGGMSTLIGAMEKELRTRACANSACRVNIVLNATATNVQAIEQQNPQQSSHQLREYDRVKVTAERGGHRRVLAADRAVIAVPLGVLKRGGSALRFSPELPRHVRRAVDALGCGATIKIALRFAEVFWPERVQFFGLVGAAPSSSKDEAAGKRYLFGDANHIEVFNMHSVRRNKVLILEMEAQYARRLSRLINRSSCVDTDNIVECADFIRLKIMPRVKIAFDGAPAMPQSFAINNYIKNSALGQCGFSFWPPGRSGDDNLALAEARFSRRVFLAGEHTTPSYYANMHGAVLEGVRVGRDVVQASEEGWVHNPSSSRLGWIRDWTRWLFRGVFGAEFEDWAKFISSFSAVSETQQRSARKGIDAIHVPKSLKYGASKKRERFVPSWCPAPCR